MKTIVITSQKGGSGKTMLAAHLAVEAERTGDAPAWLIDTDRQATLTRWHERRKADTPQRGEVRLEKLITGLATGLLEGSCVRPNKRSKWSNSSARILPQAGVRSAGIYPFLYLL
jgi:cellulose biosynthesis protein BcsQ